METIKRKTTIVGIVTLIVGLALGIGVGVWGIKTSHASNAPAVQNKSASTSVTTTEKDDSSVLSRDWDPFRQMERMQEEIDRAIRDATENFRLGPGATVFRPDAGYSSSFDLRDRKDHFELRAYLPDVNSSDVNVKIDNDRVLHVTVKQQKQETKNENGSSASFSELGQYEQVVTLPEPVRASDMKIDRHGHEVVITIPKIKST